jgi:hypothetical protein
MAAEDSAKVLASEMKSQMKKVSDQITGPMKSFVPSLIAGLPGGSAMEKSFKALKISNKKEADDTQKEIEKQTESIVGSESILKTMNENLMEMSFAMTGMFHAIKEPEDDSLSAGEVEKANEETRRDNKQITLLESISGGIGDMLKGFLNSTAAGAGMGLGAVLGLIAAPFVTLAAFFTSLKAEIKVLDGLLGGKLSAPFVAIKSYLTKVRDALKVGDKVDDLILGAKTAIANLKTFFGNWVGKLKIADKVDDIVLGAKNAVASIKTFFSGFVGKLKIADKVDDVILGAKNSVAGIKSFFSGFVGKLTPTSLGVVDDIILGAKNSATSVKSFFGGFKGAFTLTDTATDLLAPVTKTISTIKAFFNPFTTLKLMGSGAGAVGKTAETAVDGAKAGVKSIQGIMATVKSFMSPLRLGVVALDAGMAVFQPIIKFAGTLGTVLGKIFMPITILMSVFDLVTGFMDGYDEEGTIIAGMEGGISKMLVGLVGIPLDFLKAGIAWLGTKMGFDMKWLSEFSFSDMISGLVTKIFDGIQGMVDFVKDLFDFSDLTIFEVFGKLIDIVFAPLNLAINFVKGLFGFGDPDEPFSLSGLIFDTVADIFDWFKGLFDIDIMGLVKSIPGAGKVLKFFGFGEDESAVPTEDMSLDQQIAAARDRIARSEGGENVYSGRDSKGMAKDAELIEKLVAERALALETANAALEAAKEEKENANGGTTILQDNSTTVSQQGGARMAMPIPVSDESVRFQQSQVPAM